MTDYVNEFLDGKMALAEALADVEEKASSAEGREVREYYERHLRELESYTAIKYMREHGYLFDKDTCKWGKEEHNDGSDDQTEKP